MSAPQQAPAPQAPKKPRQGRSPAFPFISLKKALERAETFRVAEGGRPKHFAPLTSATKAWGIGAKTGLALQTIAAMGHYGIFEFDGSGETRSARLTESALNILLDKQPVSSERDGLIQKAALKPPIHNELWQKWQDSLPSDPTLETFLIRDKGFSESGARDLIVEYKETILFAKLGQTGIIPLDDTPLDEDNSPSDGGKVADSSVTPEKKKRREVKAGMKEDVFTTPEGDVVLQWPEAITPESLQDVEDWTKLILRKIKRSVGNSAPSGADEKD